MCYSNTGNVCFTPDPHYPTWSYSCPAEEIDVLGLGDKINLWHSFEMDYNTEHAIILCPEHRETHQVSKLWYTRFGGLVQAIASDLEITGSEPPS